MRYSGPDNNSKNLFWASLFLFLVGMHSILLGLTIYFYTDFFYKTFFAASVENIFFVRQSGIFLFLAGLYYLYPLLNLKKFHSLILIVIISKIVAVIFLISNAGYTAAPEMIYLAAFFDALMGAVLTVIYVQCRRAYSHPKPGILSTDEASIKEIAR
jgi:hypothetical protein